MGLRTCTKCGGEFQQNANNFHRNRWKRADGTYRNSWRAACRPCEAGRRREQHYRMEYGHTYAQLAEILSAQANKCAICETHLKDLGKGPNLGHVDHCHKTGVVRGILCSNCNRAIGLLGDDPWILKNAALYLK